MIDGVRIVRRGRQWSVHWRAFRRYRRKLAANFDIVVDEVNTIPFFTPLWANAPAVMFIHQLARDVWWYESRLPLSIIGFLVEPIYLRLYRNVPVLTVSASTLSDLRALGFKAHITVIKEGVEAIIEQPVVRSSNPRFVYVGRLAPSKRVSDVIRAFALFSSSTQSAELHLLGDGPERYVLELRHLAMSLGLSQLVHFHGRVSTQEKHHQMAAAHMLLLASAREGWGLVVTEANAVGTPAVAYNVPGLRDSIRPEETGLLVPPSPVGLAAAMLRLWRDPALYQRLSSEAMSWSNDFTFDTSAAEFRELLVDVLMRSSRSIDTSVRTQGS